MRRCVRYTGVFFTPTYTSANTLAACCAYMCICIYVPVCICMHMYMDAYVRLWYCSTRWAVVSQIFYLYICVHMHAYWYVCELCVYRCMCICMYMYICMSVYIYARTFIYTRVWVYICTRVGAFCLFVLSNPSTTCALSQVFLNTCMRVCVGIGSGVWACSWLALVAGVGGYVLAGVEIEILSWIFPYFCGC